MDIQEVILKILKKDDAGAEYQQLKDWKEETAENLKLYQEINQIVEEGNNLSDYREYNTESGYQRFKNEISKRQTPWLAYAAIGLILLMGGLFFLNNNEATKPAGPETFIAESSVEEFLLKDGSTISLNVGAELNELSDFSQIRKVALKGEAFFDITPDKEKPFRIQLEENTFVEVLGTSFNIINDGQNLEVVVESGHVELHADGKVISLTKGYVAKREQGSIVKFKKAQDNYLSWKNNMLVYKNAPITDVLDDIAAHFGASLNISSSVQKSNCNLSSSFSTQDLDQILLELSKVVDLSYTKKSDGSYSIKDIKCE